MNRLPIAATNTLNDVYCMLREALEAEQLIDEYFSAALVPDQPFSELGQRYRWIACYAVTGCSEGHCIHVDLVQGYDQSQAGQVLHLFTGKTFLGLAHAQKIANRCADLLGV